MLPPYYKDHADYLIFCGGWNIGRIYEIRSGTEELRWFWALHFPGRPENLRTDNRAGSLEAAKEEFEECWRRWKAGAKLEEVPYGFRPNFYCFNAAVVPHLPGTNYR